MKKTTITIQNAIKANVDFYLAIDGEFSMHNITTAIRNDLKSEKYNIVDGGYIKHDRVKSEFLKMHNDGELVLDSRHHIDDDQNRFLVFSKPVVIDNTEEEPMIEVGVLGRFKSFLFTGE